MKKLLLVVAGILGISTAAIAEPFRVLNSRGTALEAIADFPTGSGPFPVVVLAPGQGYHMALPALDTSAKKLVENGIAVVRFNWAYFSATPKGTPSNDLSLEVDDMAAVVAAVRADPRARKDYVWAAGKSLGSLVAWRLLSTDKALRGGVFLTPVCSRPPNAGVVSVPAAEENYPGLQSESRPLAFVLGDQDPLCSPPLLYKFLAYSTGKTRVAVVGGDHSFEDKTRTGSVAAKALEGNLEVVARYIALAVSNASAP